MKRHLIASVAAAALALALPVAANAIVWTSDLEYRDTGGPTPSLSATPYGTIEIEDGFDAIAGHLEGTTVKVTVTLANAASLFVNTGGPHDPFLYNLVDPASVTVVNAAGQNFFDGGRTDPAAFEATPFGKFTNKIGCCSTFVPEQNVVSGFHFEGTGRNRHKVLDYTLAPAHWVEHNGSANGILGPLVFYLHDDDGLTFAGVGAHFDLGTGTLIDTGTGNHFFSNTSGAMGGGWWFTADICDKDAPASACTYNVAARDARTDIPGVPEPATWGLMLMGFGGMGAVLRRSRRQARMAFA